MESQIFNSLRGNEPYRWEECFLTTAYLPPVAYFVALANTRHPHIVHNETYQKQSYRSRCNILSSNGVLSLSVPICRGGENFSHKLPICEVEIDYSKNWVHNHKIALTSAYKNSPFFDYYSPELFSILDSGIKYLAELNRLLTAKLLYFCGINIVPIYDPGLPYSNENCGEKAISIDLTKVIQPKYRGEDFLDSIEMAKPYWQLFNQQGFIPNLSVVDLIFNEGPNSFTLLKIA